MNLWNRYAVPLLSRIAPTERQKVFALTIVSGALCGLVAVAFHLAIKLAESLLINRAMAATGGSWLPAWIPLTILVPTLGGLFAGLMVRYVVPGAVGSGIPQVKAAYALDHGRVPMRDAIGKFFVGTVQVGSGASLGREGPTVQICAGITSLLSRWAHLPRGAARRMLPVGVAAGIAAAFNAPIAAVMFTVEEVLGDLDQTMLTGVVVAAAIAAAVERSVLGEHPVFTVTRQYNLHNASSLLLYAALGLAAGAVSLFFTESLLHVRAGFRRLTAVPQWARPAIGGLITGALAVLAIAWLKTDGVTGVGYNTLNAALAGSLTVKVLLALGVLKLIATVFSYSSGGVGGIFAPALFVGGMLGGAIGYVDVIGLQHSADSVGAFALVGMGAVFAGVIRAPITSVLIIFEMTGSYGLILPLMIANMTSYAIARHYEPVQIYEAFLTQDGIVLPHGKKAHAEPAELVMEDTPEEALQK